MEKTRKFITVAAGLLVTAGIATAVSAQSANSRLLSSLGKGLWELRAVGGGPSSAAQSRVCLGNPARLVQIQHGNANCDHRVLSESPTRVTVSYSCSGQGQGVTTIRKETGKLVQISSQGIRNGSPFHFSVEGRLTGGC